MQIFSTKLFSKFNFSVISKLKSCNAHFGAVHISSFNIFNVGQDIRTPMLNQHKKALLHAYGMKRGIKSGKNFAYIRFPIYNVVVALATDKENIAYKRSGKTNTGYKICVQHKNPFDLVLYSTKKYQNVFHQGVTHVYIRKLLPGES